MKRVATVAVFVACGESIVRIIRCLARSWHTFVSSAAKHLFPSRSYDDDPTILRGISNVIKTDHWSTSDEITNIHSSCSLHFSAPITRALQTNAPFPQSPRDPYANQWHNRRGPTRMHYLDEGYFPQEPNIFDHGSSVDKSEEVHVETPGGVRRIIHTRVETDVTKSFSFYNNYDLGLAHGRSVAADDVTSQRRRRTRLAPRAAWGSAILPTRRRKESSQNLLTFEDEKEISPKGERPLRTINSSSTVSCVSEPTIEGFEPQDNILPPPTMSSQEAVGSNHREAAMTAAAISGSLRLSKKSINSAASSQTDDNHRQGAVDKMVAEALKQAQAARQQSINSRSSSGRRKNQQPNEEHHTSSGTNPQQNSQRGFSGRQSQTESRRSGSRGKGGDGRSIHSFFSENDGGSGTQYSLDKEHSEAFAC